MFFFNRAALTLAAFLLTLFCTCGPCRAADAENLCGQLPETLTSGMPAIENGGFLVDIPGRKLACRENQPFVPASTQKIVTALAAFNILGADFRFKTEFFLQDQNLFIKGSGDPLLTSEKVAVICRQLSKILREKGITTLSFLLLDDSAFDLAGTQDKGSANPYDAQSSGLAVNFNALPLKITQGGEVLSAEPQTPSLPIFRQVGSRLEPGTHRVNLHHFNHQAGIEPGLRYTAELFSAFLQHNGIRCVSYKRGLVPADLPPLLSWKNNESLRPVVGKCLNYSNNFMANQIFLATGATRYGYPATWEKARSAMHEFIAGNLPAFLNDMTIVDGSGLSRKNRITPAALVAALQQFTPYKELLPRRNSILLKSGTLDGVYAYGGYLPVQDNLIPFALILNQQNNSRDWLLDVLFQETKAQYKSIK